MKKKKNTRKRPSYFFRVNFKLIFLFISLSANELQEHLWRHQINSRKVSENEVAFSFDETTTLEDVQNLVNVISKFKYREPQNFAALENRISSINKSLLRSSKYLQQPVFNSHHTETKMMRYLNYLERKDIALNRSMISLGSCTLKLNAAS